jgi:outer membrane protein TolC
MSGPSVRWLNAGTAALAASMLLGSCAVGPDFFHPAAPEDAGYTKEPVAPRTSSIDAPTGKAQRFFNGREVPARWWARFKSPALNALMERALDNNPTLQSMPENASHRIPTQLATAPLLGSNRTVR